MRSGRKVLGKPLSSFSEGSHASTFSGGGHASPVDAATLHNGVRRCSAQEDNWMSVFERGRGVACGDSSAPGRARAGLAPPTHHPEEGGVANSSIGTRARGGWVAGDLVLAGGRVVPVVAGQYEALGQKWLQRHPEAGSSWPSWPRAS